MSIQNERFYISTGDKHGFYTLRHSFEEPIYGQDERGNIFIKDIAFRDHHIQNLSTDPEEAAEKARQITGLAIPVPKWSLEEINRRTAEEVERARLREKREREARLDRRFGQIIKFGARELAELDGKIPQGRDAEEFQCAAIFRACWALGWESPFHLPEDPKDGHHDSLSWAKGAVHDMALQLTSLRSFLSWKQVSLLWKLVEEIPQRQVDREREARVRKSQEEAGHLGRRGQRLEVEVEIIGRHGFDSEWGHTTIWKMQTPEGHVLTWFTGSFRDWEIGQRLSGKVTIKDHGDFQGLPETKVTRCSLEPGGEEN